MKVTAMRDLTDHECALIDVAVDRARSSMERSDSLAFEGAVESLDSELQKAAIAQLVPLSIDIYSAKHGKPLTVTELVRANPMFSTDIHDCYSSLSPGVRVPAKLGNYRVNAVIGVGGQSVVVRSYDVDEDRPVAIKYTAEALHKPRLREEARTLKGLRHDHIVRVFNCSDDGPYAYCVMERLEGHTLAHQFSHVRPGAEDVVTIMRQLASAVAYVHENDLLHRDIKPENIQWSQAGRAVLFDFGLVIDREHWNSADHPIPEFHGTNDYKSPEHLLQDPKADGVRSDVYQIGAVLHFLLTGLSPRWKLLLDPASRQPAFDPAALRQLRGLRRRLARVCEHAMHRDPAERIASTESLAAAIDAATVAERRARAARQWAARLGLILIGIASGAVGYVGLSRSGLFHPYEAGVQTLSPADPRAQETLVNALASGDIDTLTSLGEPVTSARYLGRALQTKHTKSGRTVAELFFEMSDDDKACTWFREKLTNGLDPNLLVRIDEYDTASLLSLALECGAADVSLALLAAGASPHPYRSLSGSYQQNPYFIFPYVHLLQSSQFTLDEKRQIARAMQNAGAIVPDFLESQLYSNTGLYSTGDFIAASKSTCASALGLELEPSVPLIRSAKSPIAQRAAARGGKDWAGFLQTSPKSVIAEKGKPYRHCVAWTLRHLIAIHGDDAFFIGEMYSVGSELVVIHTSFGSGVWTVLVFADADGFAWGEPRPTAVDSDWRWDASCWSFLVFEQDDQTGVMRCKDGVYRMVDKDIQAEDDIDQIRDAS